MTDAASDPTVLLKAADGPRQRLGKYELLRRVGHGGMGVLFLGHNPDLDIDVAIKVLRGDFSAPDAAERFTREARALARLVHPNIVRVLDFGQDGDRLYIVMEYIDGETFAQVIERRAPLPLERRMTMFAEVCAAIGHAHTNGWIHRDLKPGNVMVDGKSGTVKVLDFGIARKIEEGLTAQPSLIGSANYMSPEQAAAKPLDHRTDVFSATAVLYELLTYRQAFPGDFSTAVEAVKTGTVEPCSSVDATLPAAIDAIVQRGLEKDPARRFQTIDELREAVIAARAGDPTFVLPKRDVVPEPAPDPTPAPIPRRRPWPALVAGVALLIVVSGVGVWWSHTNRPAAGTVEVPQPTPTLVVTGNRGTTNPDPQNGGTTNGERGGEPAKPSAGGGPGVVSPPPDKPVAPVPPGPRPQAGSSDRDAILQTLRQYAQAFNRRDARAAAALRMDAPVAALETSFARYTAVDLTITPRAPVVTGDQAEVTTTTTLRFTTTSGEQSQLDDSVTYQMSRTAQGWRIKQAIKD